MEAMVDVIVLFILMIYLFYRLVTQRVTDCTGGDNDGDCVRVSPMQLSLCPSYGITYPYILDIFGLKFPSFLVIFSVTDKTSETTI